jgi:hypothetical protein
LNPLSAEAVLDDGVAPQSFGSFMSDVPSGSSYETTDWMCHAPNPAVTVSVFETDQSGNPVATPVSVTDPNSAATTFTTAPNSQVWPPTSDTHASWVFPTCEGISDFPSIAGSASSFSSAQSPALQAKSMRSYAYGSGQLPQPTNSTDPLAAFGIMDSSEASFYGLGEASLENASGEFVAPSTATIEAALKAAQPCTVISPTCPANTYQNNWSAPDPDAYPMPDITYAIVPVGGQSAATTTAIQNLLTNLINFSTSAALPAGYYPMPAGMAQAALADLHTALSGSKASSAPNGNSSPLASVFTIPKSGTVTASVPSETSTTTPSLLVASGQAPTGGSPSSTSKKGRSGVATPTPVIPPDLSRVFLSTASRLLLPYALIVEVICLAGGLFFLLRARSKRRRALAGDLS